MKPAKASTGLFVLLLLPSILTSQIHAQNDYSIQFSMLKAPFLRLDYIPVSARSAAMGGAFIGAAQDESAAPINPAGLAIMQKAGISLNQHWSQTQYYPPGYEIDPMLAAGFKAIRFDQTMVGVFVPLKNFTIAMHRQVVLDADFFFETQPIISPSSTGSDSEYDGRQVNLDYKLISDAISVGFRLHRRLSIGISGKLTGLKLNLGERIFTPDQSNNNAENLDATVGVAHRLNEPNFSAGIMADVSRSKLFAGAVYHYNPSYALKADMFFPTRIDDESGRAPELVDFKLCLNIPDIYGAGLYYVPSDRWSFTFDVVRILYSQLATEIRNTNSAQLNMSDVAPESAVYKPKNATEIRFGIEYLPPVPDLGFIPLQTIFLRTGLYSDPGQKWRSDGDRNLLYPEVDSNLRFSFGLGLQITNHLKIDVAGVATGDRVEAVGSALVSVDIGM